MENPESEEALHQARLTRDNFPGFQTLIERKEWKLLGDYLRTGREKWLWRRNIVRRKASKGFAVSKCFL
jgi:hypothetical protein